MKTIFENIIKNRYWRDSVCGTGSTLRFTVPLRENLPGFLKKHNLTSMLDAPCGDYSWMSAVDLPADFKYVGADIVESLVRANKKNYPTVEFDCIDITQDPLPEVDVLFCRDCLIHLSFQDIQKTFENVLSSNIQYVMLTNYHDADPTDISTGNFRKTCFTAAPIDLGPPIDSIFDWIPGTVNGNQKKDMSLWHTHSIKHYLEHL